MKAVLLDGIPGGDETGRKVREQLLPVLEAQGWETERLALCDRRIGACAGDFFCWIKHPGTCWLEDDNREIARKVMNAELTVYLTPVTFGGYSSVLKKAVDHLIQNLSPYFLKVNGETHHQKRYDTYSDLLVVGYEPEAEPRRETVFRHLVQRNAINWWAERYACAILRGGDTDTEMQTALATAVADLKTDPRPAPVTLPESSPKGPARLQRNVLLIGSPKTRQSNSLIIGDYFSQQLAPHGTATETFFLHTMVRSPEKMEELFRTIDAADLVTLSFPLYVDSLPAPAIDALEQVAAARQNAVTRPAFVAIANSGFPENVHNLTSLAICETFASEAGFAWAGGLSVGSGGGLVAGRPMTSGRTARIRKSLELAADALRQGQGIPPDAQTPMEKPVIPHWMYRSFGNLGWKMQAKPYRTGKSFRDQPYR